MNELKDIQQPEMKCRECGEYLKQDIDEPVFYSGEVYCGQRCIFLEQDQRIEEDREKRAAEFYF